MLSNEQIISLILLYISFGKMVAIAYLDFDIVAETSISITEVSTSANGQTVMRQNSRSAKLPAAKLHSAKFSHGETVIR